MHVFKILVATCEAASVQPYLCRGLDVHIL